MKTVKPQFSEKTLRVTVYFFTDSIAQRKGEVIPKHCSDCGGVVMPANGAHGIRSDDKGAMFNSYLELPAAIHETLRQNGVTLHLGRVRL
jgi:hypothetical protein